jgi:hypothetical protein
MDGQSSGQTRKKGKSQRVKGDMCHHCKGDMWHDRTGHTVLMWHMAHRTSNQAGDVACPVGR